MATQTTGIHDGQLEEHQYEQLTAQVRGTIIRPNDEAYEEARHVYNEMIDRRPALILRAADAADVMAGLRFARENDLPLSVRSGGHNVAGFSVNDGGMVLDLSPMRGVRVDPARSVASVGGGATWGDVDHAAWPFGLVTPGGVISTTGVAGLGLGGGFGHLSRRFGLVVDNIRSIDVVTANGEFVQASADRNADLFWALRGGGGNFGIVTHLELQMHAIPGVYAGPIFFPIAEAGQILRFYRDFVAEAPRELGIFFAFAAIPGAPFVPEHLRGQTAATLVVAWTGDPDRAEDILRPVRAAGTVLVDVARPTTYPALNRMFDAAHPFGHHHYWKADFVTAMDDDVIAIHERFGPDFPNPMSIAHIYPMNGAIHDVASDATAFSYRDVNFVHVIGGVDPDPAMMPERIEWARSYWSALHPHSARGAYVNFLMEEGDDRIRATYRDNYPRLAQVKQRWDPHNVFRLNQNIPPARSNEQVS
jgi:FAD/FMN-containing dehydrogenase